VRVPQLLLFSDPHSDLAACRRLVDQAADVDIAVGAGDFCMMRRGLDATIEVLSAIDRPTVLVPGNSESADELTAACRAWPQAHVLHGAGTTIGGLSFYGIGGGIPVTPFGAWSHDFTEAEATDLLAGCPPDAILVAHSPPKGLVDRDSRGRSLGSTAFRHVVEAKTPRLVVCGHVHGSWGQKATCGPSTIINAGPQGMARAIAASA
jgi:Icc-related predicted phosphoesterase